MRTYAILGLLNHRENQAVAPATTACPRTLTALSLAVLVVGLCGGVAKAAGETSVVPPGGNVAGEGYAYWLGAKEQAFFSSPRSGPKACGTLHAPGGTVAFLDGGNAHGTITCGEPAERPIYVNGVTSECSTLPGDHTGFGTSPAQLKRCARTGFKGLSGTAAVDGVQIVNYRTLIADTQVIQIRVPQRNQFGIKGRSGTSAAYGEALLLSGLSGGTHTIRVTASISGKTYPVIYKLHIR